MRSANATSLQCQTNSINFGYTFKVMTDLLHFSVDDAAIHQAGDDLLEVDPGFRNLLAHRWLPRQELVNFALEGADLDQRLR